MLAGSSRLWRAAARVRAPTRAGGARLHSSEATQRVAPAIPPVPDVPPAEDEPERDEALKPNEVVAQLDRYIIGQAEAKKATAIAIRNRWRRQQVSGALRDEITPKNILMIGPTGVGKTEIARRMAKMIGAPFIKARARRRAPVARMAHAPRAGPCTSARRAHLALRARARGACPRRVPTGRARAPAPAAGARRRSRRPNSRRSASSAAMSSRSFAT